MPGVLDVLSSGELSLLQNVMALDLEYFHWAGNKGRGPMPIETSLGFWPLKYLHKGKCLPFSSHHRAVV